MQNGVQTIDCKRTVEVQFFARVLQEKSSKLYSWCPECRARVCVSWGDEERRAGVQRIELYTADCAEALGTV